MSESMRRALVLALNDLRLTAKDRPVIFWMIIMPIAFVVLLGSMNTGGGDAPKVALAVVDEDQSFLSHAFRDALSREGFSIRDIPVGDIDSLETSPRSVRIPPGFQDSVAAACQVPIYFHKKSDADASYSMTAEMHLQRAIIQILVHLAQTAKRLSGSDAAKGSISEETPEGAFHAISALFSSDAGLPMPIAIDERFGRTFAEVAAESSTITVETETAGRGRAVPSGTAQSLPAIITLFMLLNTAIYGAVFLTQEKQDRVLQRIATFPLSRGSILAGKLLGRTLLALLQAAVLLLAGRFLLGAYLGNSLLGLLFLILCLALAVASLALFWGAILRRVEQAVAVVMIVSLFLGGIGGCWWPLEVVPAWMRTAGHISPAAWAMDGFHSLISFGAGGSAVVLPCLILLAYALVFALAGARLLRFSD